MAKAKPTEVLIVDRREGDVVVLETEDGGTVDLPGWMVPEGLREGDVLRARVSRSAGAARVEFSVDADETRRRREAAKQQVAKLRARDPGGDVAL